VAKVWLRTASVACLAIWAAICLLFLLLRLSPLDIRTIPGIGMVMLTALVVALAAPALAAWLAGVALIRSPRKRLTVLVFGCAIAALLGDVCLFLIARWL
jgi:hypothetical protein